MFELEIFFEKIKNLKHRQFKEGFFLAVADNFAVPTLLKCSNVQFFNTKLSWE